MEETFRSARKLQGAPVEEDTTGRPLEEPTAEAGSSEEEAIPSAKKLRTGS